MRRFNEQYPPSAKIPDSDDLYGVAAAVPACESGHAKRPGIHNPAPNTKDVCGVAAARVGGMTFSFIPLLRSGGLSVGRPVRPVDCSYGWSPSNPSGTGIPIRNLFRTLFRTYSAPYSAPPSKFTPARHL